MEITSALRNENIVLLYMVQEAENSSWTDCFPIPEHFSAQVSHNYALQTVRYSDSTPEMGLHTNQVALRLKTEADTPNEWEKEPFYLFRYRHSPDYGRP